MLCLLCVLFGFFQIQHARAFPWRRRPPPGDLRLPQETRAIRQTCFSENKASMRAKAFHFAFTALEHCAWPGT